MECIGKPGASILPKGPLPTAELAIKLVSAKKIINASSIVENKKEESDEEEEQEESQHTSL